MQRLQDRRGFTLFELMIVIAIMGVITAMVAPIFARYQLKEEARTNAVIVAGALRQARDRALREGRFYLVYFNSPASAPGAFVRVVQDNNNSLQEDAGDVARDIFFDGVTSAQVMPYGVGGVNPLPAAPRAPSDGLPGTLGTVTDGSGFPGDILAPPIGVTTVMIFNSRGIPVVPSNPNGWGLGAGAFYLTDSNNVYAADVGPLGDVSVRTFNVAQNAWQ